MAYGGAGFENYDAGYVPVYGELPYPGSTDYYNGSQTEYAQQRDVDYRRDRRRREQEDEEQWEIDRDRERYGVESYPYPPQQYPAVEDYDARAVHGGAGFGNVINENYYESSGLPPTLDYGHGFVPEARNENDWDPRDKRFGGGIPSCTIFVGGLALFIEEKDLLANVRSYGLEPKDVRIVRRKEMGSNRGFAFVDFHCIADAQYWMEQTQGVLYLCEGFTTTLSYSIPKNQGSGPRVGRPEPRIEPPARSPAENITMTPGDWKCIKCGCVNFKKREKCFKCDLKRDESEKRPEDGRSYIGVVPNDSKLIRMIPSSILMRGLDALTTESMVTDALAEVSRTKVKNLYIMRDSSNGTSLGYGFVETYSTPDAVRLMETLHGLDYPLEINKKIVLFTFSKHSYTTMMSLLSQSEYNPGFGYDQSYYNSSAYDNQSSSSDPPISFEKGNTTNAAAAVAQAAVKLLKAAKGQVREPGNKEVGSATVSYGSLSGAGDANDYSNFAPPDVTRYVYDESSSYYFDSVTGLYYDSKSQYFYDSQTSRFLFWDQTKQSYIPVSTEETQQEPKNEVEQTPTVTPVPDPIEEQKSEKAKKAKKIAKEMERWAKQQNAQKDSGFKKPLAPPISLGAPKQKSSAAADAGFNILAKSKSEKFTIDLMKSKDDKKLPPAAANALLPGLVASYGDSDSDDEQENAIHNDVEQTVEEKLTDWSKLTCLLCKRAFASADILTKHQQMSELHKKNLEEYKQKLTGTVIPVALAKTSRPN